MADSRQTQKRNRYRCLICRSSVLKLTQHIRTQHMAALYNCKLWGNFGLLGGRYVSPRGRYYKLCPISGCASILPDIPRHLRDKHHYHRSASIETSKRAVKIRDMDWAIPQLREDVDRSKYLDPYPSSAGKQVQSYRRRIRHISPELTSSSEPEGGSIVF